ncbi:MAG: hypothetical protein WCG87_05330 [Bacteroidota bacterium]
MWQFNKPILNNKWTLLFAFLSCCMSQNNLSAQGCCSGGSCSPIAGGTSQGVLLKRQAEISTSFQYIYSNNFQSGTKKVRDYLDSYTSKYQYSRVAYGLTKRLTLSLEFGYYFDKTQIGLNNNNKVSSSGIGDMIIFPRFTVLKKETASTENEATLGLGYKIPLGKYLDSSVVFTDPNTLKNYYTPKPPSVMTTTGSQDIVFYGFGFRSYPSKNLRLFTSIIYVRKGWNPIGQRFGDYAGIGLFAGKTIYKKLGLILQLKGEWVDKMGYDKNIDMLAKYNFDVLSTGGKKVLFIPQLSYSYKTLSFYISSDIPLYQYVNGTAIASEYQFTTGLSYRFMARRKG